MGNETLATQLREIAVELAPQAQAGELRPGAFVFEDPDVNKVAVDALNAAADRLSLLSPELGGWQGMESYRPGVDPARVLIAREYKLAVMVSNYDSDREGLADDEPPYGFGWKDITHWMPLPPPPTGAR